MMAPTAALVATAGAVVSAVQAPSQVQMALAVPVELAVPAVRDTTVSLEPAKTVQAAAMGVLAAWAVSAEVVLPLVRMALAAPAAQVAMVAQVLPGWQVALV